MKLRQAVSRIATYGLVGSCLSVMLTGCAEPEYNDVTSKPEIEVSAPRTTPLAVSTTSPSKFYPKEGYTRPPIKPAAEPAVERVALRRNDPQVAQAHDFVAAIINLNGYLCADIINVVPISGTEFEVTCIERRDGPGRVRYRLDGENNTARRL